MTRARFDGLFFLVLGTILFLLLGTWLRNREPGRLIDFKALYYSGRCLLQRCDPYNEIDLQKFYLGEVGGHPTEPPQLRPVVTVLMNVPIAFTFVIPISLLPWGPAYSLWLILSGGSLILASFLMWRLGADYAPAVSGLLLGILLATSIENLVTGNTAGIVVGFTVIAVWCFLQDRFVTVGLLCLATSLAIKPHDAGLIWLYFLMAGGALRKRALQTLVLAVALGLPGLLLVWHVAPHWMTEFQSNLSWFSAPGHLNNLGRASDVDRNPDSIIDLQTITSLFYDDARIYGPLSYLISGALVLLWLISVLKSKSSQLKDRFALAAIAALSMLLGYHRQHDAKIMLLTFPAFAMLWAERGLIGWFALLLTTACVLLNGDITSMIRFGLAKNLLAHSSGMMGTILTIVVARPVPIILAATGIFYLWAYIRYTPAPGACAGPEEEGHESLFPAPIEPGIPASASLSEAGTE